MAVLHGTEIVHAIRERERLRVGQIFADLLDRAVDIAEVRINLGNNLTVDARAEMQHAVCRGVLRAEIDHIVVIGKERRALAMQRAVGVERIAGCEVRNRFVTHSHFLVLLFGLVIFAERKAHPVFAQEDAAQIRVIHEDHAVEVIHFAFVEIRNVPEVAGRRQHRLFAVGAHGLDMHHFEGLGVGEGVHRTESFLSPVHTGEVFEERIALVFQFGQTIVELFGRHEFGFDFVHCGFRLRFGRCGTRCGASRCRSRLFCHIGGSRRSGGCRSSIGGLHRFFGRCGRCRGCFDRGRLGRHTVFRLGNGRRGDVLFVLFHQAFSSCLSSS